MSTNRIRISIFGRKYSNIRIYSNIRFNTDLSVSFMMFSAFLSKVYTVYVGCNKTQSSTSICSSIFSNTFMTENNCVACYLCHVWLRYSYCFISRAQWDCTLYIRHHRKLVPVQTSKPQ